MMKRLRGFFAGAFARQFVLAVVGVHALLTIVLVWQGVSAYNTLLHNRLVLRTLSNATLLRESVLPLVMGHDLIALDNLLQRSRLLPDVDSLAVVDEGGAVLGHTESDKVGKFMVDARSEALRLAPATSDDATLVLLDSDALIEAGAPLISAGHRLGWVRVTVSPASTVRSQRIAAAGAAAIGIFAILAGALIASMVARRVSRRLRYVLQVVGQYQASGVAPPLDDQHPDEVGELSRALTQFMAEISTRRERDIADRDILEQTVRERTRALDDTRKELEIIVDNIPALVFYKDTENRYLRVNRYMASAYGLPKSAIEGKSLSELASPDMAQKYWEDDLRVIRSQTASLNIEEPWETSDGRRWVLTSKVPIADESGAVKGVLGISIDVTDRKALEEAIKRSNQELEQFAYVASHDLQEPLRMVASYAELLGERYRGKLDEKADKYIGYAVDGAKRMQGLINDLLTYSRVGTHEGHRDAVNVEAALKEALVNLEVALRDSQGVVTHSELPTVLADRTQMVQLLQNLIGNALKFRGTARVEVHVSALCRYGEWTFSVRDNGIGLDPQFADRIFRVFQRLHERGKYPGSGIGLAICKKIVERHGGRIWVESQPGQGATFLFTWPEQVSKSDLRISTDDLE